MADRTGQRIGAVVMALIFVISSFGLTGFVIWQIRQDSKNKKAQDAAVTSAATAQKEAQLQGTKLKDFTPIAKIEALDKIDTVVGTGDEVKPGDTVTAHYTGAVAADGTIFQSSHDGANQPVPFSLSGVIKGWTDGVPGMKVGGKRRLLIPADQAYGANPPQGSGIPANADLVFDIELVKIGQ